MNPITKDTPVGTRVIAVGPGGTLYRGTVYAEPDRHRVEVQLDRINSSSPLVSCQLASVYIDEPAPGTWAWACEQALNNQPTVRDHGRVKLEMVNDTLRLLVRYRDGWDYVDFGRDDLTATDWEIAK